MELIVKKGTKEILNDQFSNRDDLIEIYIPKTVEVIKAGAFYNCGNLERVIFEAEAKLKHIGNYAFQNCKNLKQINLPEGIVGIGAHAFWHCTKLPLTLTLPASIKKLKQQHSTIQM